MIPERTWESPEVSAMAVTWILNPRTTKDGSEAGAHAGVIDIDSFENKFTIWESNHSGLQMYHHILEFGDSRCIDEAKLPGWCLTFATFHYENRIAGTNIDTQLREAFESAYGPSPKGGDIPKVERGSLFERFLTLFRKPGASVQAGCAISNYIRCLALRYFFAQEKVLGRVAAIAINDP